MSRFQKMSSQHNLADLDLKFVYYKQSLKNKNIKLLLIIQSYLFFYIHPAPWFWKMLFPLQHAESEKQYAIQFFFKFTFSSGAEKLLAHLRMDSIPSK